MKTLELIRESSTDVEFITEEVNGSKNTYIEGIFAQAEVRNGNGRRYPKVVMEQAVDKYINEFIATGRSAGEINHPDYPLPDPEQACIMIQELKWMDNGKDVYGKALVLNTPKGQIVKGLMEGGYRWGISTRGLGELVERGGYKEVQKGYMMTAHDLVNNPSGPDCYVDRLVESTKWQLNESTGVWSPAQNESNTQNLNGDLILEKVDQLLKVLKKQKQ